MNNYLTLLLIVLAAMVPLTSGISPLETSALRGDADMEQEIEIEGSEYMEEEGNRMLGKGKGKGKVSKDLRTRVHQSQSIASR